MSCATPKQKQGFYLKEAIAIKAIIFSHSSVSISFIQTAIVPMAD
jgi:hypothetical protein